MSLVAFGRDMLAEARRIASSAVARDGTHVRWATVTDTAPLRIRYDGETAASVVSPQTTEPVNVGDRVVVLKQQGQAIVVGPAGGRAWPLKALDRGSVTITPAAANSPIRTTVTFSAGVFTDPPDVLLTVNSGTTGSHTWRVSTFSVTVTDFVINFMRSGTTATEITWVAIQK